MIFTFPKGYIEKNQSTTNSKLVPQNSISRTTNDKIRRDKEKAEKDRDEFRAYVSQREQNK